MRLSDGSGIGGLTRGPNGSGASMSPGSVNLRGFERRYSGLVPGDLDRNIPYCLPRCELESFTVELLLAVDENDLELRNGGWRLCQT